MNEPRMTYPKWMNDALASDLNREIERREAAARTEQQAAIDAMQRWLDEHLPRIEEGA